MKQDAAAAEAEFQGNLDAYGDAKSNFFDYFKNAKPNYGMLYGGGYADGGRIGLNEGGSAENATNQFQMKLAELLEVGVPLEEAEKQAMDFMQRAFKGLGGYDPIDYNQGGRVGLNMGGMGGIMNAGSIPQTPTVPDGMQLDGRGGGFIPMGAQEKRDDVPAMLAKNEFVMTSDAVRAAGGGSIEKGAQRMYDMMNQLEAQV